MIRILVFALFLVIGYLLIKKVARWLSGLGKPNGEASPSEEELIKDPQCGAYFLKQRGVEALVGGERIYFCSEACRGKYMAIRKQR